MQPEVRRYVELAVTMEKKSPFSLIPCSRVHLDWFLLVRFYGISTNFGYLMPNPIFTCILNI